MTGLTYPEVGATRDDSLPAGYRHVRRRVEIGRGTAAMAAAATALMTFEFLRRAGLRPVVTASRAAVGVGVTGRFGIGPLRLAAPCRIVWTVDGQDAAGFGYGTLAGHPERGEEAFVVSLDDDVVWFTVRAFSRPDRWYVRAGGPAAHWTQDLVTRRYIAAMHRCVADARPTGD